VSKSIEGSMYLKMNVLINLKNLFDMDLNVFDGSIKKIV